MTNSKGPWGQTPPPGNEPPDIDELTRKAREKFKSIFPDSGGNGKGSGWNKKTVGLIVVVLVALWLINGFFRVDPEEKGVILRFGEFSRIAEPGLNFHLPNPIETVIKVPFTTINRTEVGVLSSSGLRRTFFNRNTMGQQQSDPRRVPEESLMLTGDKNIIDIGFEVQWKVQDPKKFLFNVRNPESTVKSVAESAMREVVGRNNIDDVLTTKRDVLGDEARDIIQAVMNSYDAGVEIVRLQMGEVQPPPAVINAFRDVITAGQDKNTMRNEATRYRNEIVNSAEGEAKQMVNEAEGYKQSVIAVAEGDASRFLAVYNEYKLAKNVTRKRMYLETMEEIFANMNKVLIDKEAGGGILPHFPVNDLMKKRGAE